MVVSAVRSYQLVLDLSSTTSLKAAVSAGPFLLRLTAIVALSTASQLAIRDAPFLDWGKRGGVAGDDDDDDAAGSQLLHGSYFSTLTAATFAQCQEVTNNFKASWLRSSFCCCSEFIEVCAF